MDIRLSPAIKTFSISGRVLESDNNQPVANAAVVIYLPSADGRSGQYAGRSGTGPTGEFVATSLRPGRLRLTVDSTYGNSAAPFNGSDPVFVDVVDEDVTGVEIRVKRGRSISGIAVIEGDTNIPNAPRLTDQRVLVMVRGEGDGANISTVPRFLQFTADGRFRVKGLTPGKASFMETRMPGVMRLALMRVERDGQTVREGMEVGAGETLTGVRLAFAYATASISGQVLATGGTLPPGVAFAVLARPAGGGMSGGSARSDARGSFSIEGSPPGQYELEARPIAVSQNSSANVPATSVKQTVTVGSGENLKVTLTYAIRTP